MAGPSSSRGEQQHNFYDAPRSTAPQQGSWYQFGTARCTNPGCAFTGSPKSLEMHMMDRHLVYPPGWDHRNKKPDWDADPSLKGKPIPIQGTTVNLDDPETLAAWIAERKRRWPSAGRVEDKKRKIDEAIAQWTKTKSQGLEAVEAGEEGREMDQEEGGEQTVDGEAEGEEVLSASDDDAPPEVTTSKPQALVDHASDDAEEQTQPEVATIQVTQRPIPAPNIKPMNKPRPPQPKKAPHNPFASRPTLLRNLLLPEIRMTVSNLSQAIRFIVDNDFLKDVELKPGQANEKMIEVLDDSRAVSSQSHSV
ncbi:hypothetical protein FIBSPDRAFT_1037703 [Athelia psychrophila]|uniref:FMR1-interacting protein 1 conserved domain-containing protein n=1 Tax=Athelia psychrophila TaxID=1759441 RepID=A0A166U2R4_9AGAM|nr:hypothetical protein FIBSPDRAFT_1037703 [Fibularhizoctonia sp. CBS 109695]